MKPFSSMIWELDWTELLPWELEGGIRVEWAEVDELLAFVGEHYAGIFDVDHDDERFLPDPMTPAKRRHLERSDRFLFRDGDRVVGVLTGNPHDWSTYYWRTVAFLPEYQGKGLLAACLQRTDAVMREAGIERVEGEAAPMNYRQIRLLHRLGYIVSGQSNSDRWGTMLRLRRHLTTSSRARFKRQFCPRSSSLQEREHDEKIRYNVVLDQ